MELSFELACPCRPGFVYKNATSLAVHKGHKARETTQEVRVQSKNRLSHKEELESVLLRRIQVLEEEVKTQLEGVYVS